MSNENVFGSFCYYIELHDAIATQFLELGKIPCKMSGAMYVFDECAQPRWLSKLLVINYIMKIWGMKYEDENKTSLLYQIPCIKSNCY